MSQPKDVTTVGLKGRILDAPYEDFTAFLLPLYSGPYVTVRIGSSSREYRVSKALLCKQSPYLAAMFEGNFREGIEQSTTLEEEDGVVSERSFKMLLQWLYLGRVIFGESAPEEEVSATLEFVRFADLCGVTGIESLMAEHIKAVIIANPAPESYRFQAGRDPDTNTFCLRSQHIVSVALLPEGHPVRGVFAAASVEGYLRRDGGHKFWKETQEVPNFAADLLKAVRATLKTLTYVHNITFIDPISGTKLGLFVS